MNNFGFLRKPHYNLLCGDSASNSTDMKSIRHVKHRSLKKIIKRGVQHIVARSGPHTRSARHPRLLVLMYHRILPAEDARAQLEEPGMMVTPQSFQLHLETLQQHFSIVRLDDWLRKRQNGEPVPDKACAITFDDGWADNYEFAFPLLQQHGIPATIFLVSDMMGTHEDFWPGRVALLLIELSRLPEHIHKHPALDWLPHRFNENSPSIEQISATIKQLKSMTDAEIHQHIDNTEQQFEIQYSQHTPSLLDWSQINTMLDSGLIEMGSHTCRHTRLNDDISSEQLQHEIIHSKAVIEQHTGKPVSTFCYPNGDLCEEAVQLVQNTYAGAVTTQHGWNTIDTPAHTLQRIGVHEDISSDRTAFLARISGWL